MEFERETRVVLVSAATFVGAVALFVVALSPLRSDPVALVVLGGIVLAFTVLGAVLDSATIGRQE